MLDGAGSACLHKFLNNNVCWEKEGVTFLTSLIQQIVTGCSIAETMEMEPTEPSCTFTASGALIDAETQPEESIMEPTEHVVTQTKEFQYMFQIQKGCNCPVNFLTKEGKPLQDNANVLEVCIGLCFMYTVHTFSLTSNGASAGG